VTSVGHARAVPRLAKPARQTFRSISASPEATRLVVTHDGCGGPRRLPRRLCRPRHGLRM